MRRNRSAAAEVPRAAVRKAEDSACLFQCSRAGEPGTGPLACNILPTLADGLGQAVQPVPHSRRQAPLPLVLLEPLKGSIIAQSFQSPAIAPGGQNALPISDS